MSRPPGSEAITVDDLREAIERLRERNGRSWHPTQAAVATEAGISVDGLYAFHARRRGMPWQAFLAFIDSVRVPYGLKPPPRPDDSDMRSLVVPLTPELAEHLRAYADADHRHPRHEAAILLEEAIRQRQAKPPRPLAPLALTVGFDRGR